MVKRFFQFKVTRTLNDRSITRSMLQAKPGEIFKAWQPKKRDSQLCTGYKHSHQDDFRSNIFVRENVHVSPS